MSIFDASTGDLSVASEADPMIAPAVAATENAATEAASGATGVASTGFATSESRKTETVQSGVASRESTSIVARKEDRAFGFMWGSGKAETITEVELITPARVRELIKVGKAAFHFHELIRFLRRTLSSPHSVAASFALPHDENDKAVGRGDAIESNSDSSSMRRPNNNESGARERIACAAAGRPAVKLARSFPNRDQRGQFGGDSPKKKTRAWAEQGASAQGVDPILMNIEAASLIWTMLRQLGAEDVADVARSALKILIKTMYLEGILDSCVFAQEGRVLDDESDDRLYPARADLRGILLVLEHPDIQDPDFENTLNTLFKLAMRLSSRQAQELIQFFSNVDKTRFTRYLEAVHQYIALRLYSGEKASEILTAVQFNRILHTANQASVTPKVGEEAFYSEAINSELFARRSSLIDQYSAWREDNDETNPAKFKSLISFGEVLDPASKAAVLSLDSSVQMRVQMRGMISNELQEAILTGVFYETGLILRRYLMLRVRRSHIVEDSLRALVMTPDDDLKKPLKVHFVGEEGVDEGGVQKEYFQVMLRELLNPSFAMFKHDEESRTLWFNSDSLEAKGEFELVGMLLGIAIYNSIIVDLRFPFVVYKRVMGVTPTLQDLEEAQPTLGRGLRQLLDFDGDVETTFSRTFQISYEVFGEVKTFDLKEGGGNIPVTKANRREYVNLYVQWMLVDSVKDQYGAFERGFQKVVGGRALSLFRPSELELLICGNPQLDFKALERNSKYEDGYRHNDVVVRNFWKVVHEFSEDSKRKLLKFVTGSDRAPIQGLGSSSLSFVISRNGDDSDRLPSAHTCFNHILLPSYSTKEKLAERLTLAIEQSEGFGLR